MYVAGSKPNLEMNAQSYKVNKSMRLDSFLASNSNFTRSKVQRLIVDGQVFVDGAILTKPSHILKCNSTVKLIEPDIVEQNKIPAQKIEIDILYQDNDIAVINKPQGMIVHPAGNIYTDTLVNALLYNLDCLSGINGELRPGIVHRLDKETSGVMLIAKHDNAHNHLSRQFAERTVSKRYLGVVSGKLLQDAGTINAPIARHKRDRKKMAVMINGKHATTKYKVLKQLNNNSQLVEFDLLTGRTHQIRVHCKYLRHPIVGDIIYGDTNKCACQLLHSHKVSFVHPSTNRKMHFEAQLPDYFIAYLDKYKENV